MDFKNWCEDEGGFFGRLPSGDFSLITIRFSCVVEQLVEMPVPGGVGCFPVNSTDGLSAWWPTKTTHRRFAIVKIFLWRSFLKEFPSQRFLDGRLVIKVTVAYLVQGLKFKPTFFRQKLFTENLFYTYRIADELVKRRNGRHIHLSLTLTIPARLSIRETCLQTC